VSQQQQQPDNNENWMQDADLEPYFRHRTNEFLTFQMDETTRKEVIHVYNSMARGGNDKGGYWDMARQLAEREAVREDPKEEPVRYLESSSTPSLSRRRKKR
jgi:hypothetical protein